MVANENVHWEAASQPQFFFPLNFFFFEDSIDFLHKREHSDGICFIRGLLTQFSPQFGLSLNRKSAGTHTLSPF